MKILARHLTADLFNCKNSRLQDLTMIKESLQEILGKIESTLITSSVEKISEDHYAAMILFREGHITMHVYTALKYVAMDIFLCQKNAQPDNIASTLREFFKPDKIKTTLLKRGDFGSAKDIRPKVKTHVAPLRKIHNTGAKVIRALARRNRY
ncbi:adenosylmethionine decarboxylase [Mitsuokella sp. oral taxon 131]|uniref:adenosylmethionine decarboxylase n=1 Tax=Mitsuokella sp. oral taxon 131 TaxID=1321780 RepID=UPI0003AE1863|nr:adenosylmethionine decarboxylase [Mitsuokella sp. oral taxon 131]ERL25314.1 putative S-adenosylmethionine decarboxylase proenzyme [Mitsuokella sp. oral taxon 131 str. W9106]